MVFIENLSDSTQQQPNGLKMTANPSSISVRSNATNRTKADMVCFEEQLCFNMAFGY